MNPLLIAHRSDTQHYPENTMAALTGAWAAGADGIEFDVQVTGDHQPIVVHNYLFDRQKKYPTLAAVLQEYGQRGRLEIEIKSTTETDISAIADIVAQYPPRDAEITSSVQPVFPLLAKYFPHYRRGLIFRRWLIENWMPADFRWSWIQTHLQLCQAQSLHMDLDLYTEAIVAHLHELDMEAHSHLKLPEQSSYQLLCRYGMDAFTTDCLREMKDYADMRRP
jgi:glycerophosphoryl diester phosphodiesterase